MTSNDDSPKTTAAALAPEQKIIVDRAQQACRYMLKHQTFEREGPGEIGEYERGFTAACELCETAIVAHVMRHLADDMERLASWPTARK